MNYTITEERLRALIYAELLLGELEDAGVDNWEGYEDINWAHLNVTPSLLRAAAHAQ